MVKEPTSVAIIGMGNAHSAAFDVDMLKKEGIDPKSVICTLKLARYFDKEALSQNTVCNI